jgi:uncharacterized protein (DUF885 family)
VSPDATHPIHALSDELVDAICTQSPMTATFLGVKGHDDRWDDVSPAGQEARAQTFAAFAERLASLPPSSDPRVQLALRVHREFLAERIEFLRAGEPFFDLNNITSTFQMLTMVFDFADRESRAGLEAMARRLETLDEAAESWRALLRAGMAKGKVVAQRQVRAAIEEGRAKTRAPSFAQRMIDGLSPAAVDAALRVRLERAADHATSALAELTDWLETDYLPHASPTDGVGRERYERAMRRFLGMKLDPLEAYAWGWEEIRRIEAQMERVAGTIEPGATARAVADRLAHDPAASLALPEPFLGAMRERQARALAQLAETHFDVPERVRTIEVKLTPAGGKPGAYYTPPAEDFSRPGIVWYSPGDRASMPLWQEITTAYHEGFPGHHLQVAMQVHQGDRLTRFQRLLADWPGHSEGWALYAEQLMLELGYFEKPEYVLGMYAGQLVRAYRVVVDIGLHLELAIPSDFPVHAAARWTAALAEELLRERALLEPSVAASEVVRYLGWPAQAITYKLGQRVLLEVREERRAREGASFDLKRFHSDVVGLGGVGLATLRETLLE